VFLQSLTYVLMRAAESRSPEHAQAFLSKLALDGNLALHGEPWRVFTFVIMPPLADPIFLVVILYVFYVLGTALENLWGTFRFNAYLLIGWLATVIVALAIETGPASNIYLMQCVFLAFAYLYPETIFLLFFVFPVKAKWLALATWIMFLMQFFAGDWLNKGLILAAIANFLLFFHNELWQSAKLLRLHMQTRAKFVPPADEPFHRCTTCGVTDKSDRKMEFRYCPQCAGTLCYCINHINAHEHRTVSQSATT
jgi:hypothetical protein